MSSSAQRRRLALLEQWRVRLACRDPWHDGTRSTQTIDYRQSIRALRPDAPAAVTPLPDEVCPSCGQSRHRIRVVGVAFPDYLQEHPARERFARRLLVEEARDA